MEEKFLPLGSVVRLVKGNKRIMIIGRLQIREADQKIFDYAACYYPEGLLDPEQLFLFQHEDIEEVYAMGYQDQEEHAMNEYIHLRNHEIGRE